MIFSSSVLYAKTSLVLSTIIVCSLFCVVRPTTIAAARCTNGIVIVADSLSTNGPFISHTNAKKLFLLTPSTIIGCVSDNSADFCRLYENLRETTRTHEFETGTVLNTKAIAHYARKLIYGKYRNAHIIIAGNCRSVKETNSTTEDIIDSFTDERKSNNGDAQYMLCEIIKNGTRIDGDVIVAGSGSALITPMAEELFSEYHGDDNIEDRYSSHNSKHHHDTESTDCQMDERNVSNVQTHDLKWIPNNSNSKSALQTAAVKHKVPLKAAVTLLTRALARATRLDSNSGGRRHSVWVLTNDTVQSVELQEDSHVIEHTYRVG